MRRVPSHPYELREDKKLVILCICASSTHQVFWLWLNRASLVAQRVKNLPARQETWVRSLGQEDPLEKETATHSSILSWTEEPDGLQSMVLRRVGYD